MKEKYKSPSLTNNINFYKSGDNDVHYKELRS